MKDGIALPADGRMIPKEERCGSFRVRGMNGKDGRD